MVDGLGTRTKDGQARGPQFDTERINQEPSAQITPIGIHTRCRRHLEIQSQPAQI